MVAKRRSSSLPIPTQGPPRVLYRTLLLDKSKAALQALPAAAAAEDKAKGESSLDRLRGMPLSCWRSRVLADGSLEEYLVPSEDNNIT